MIAALMRVAFLDRLTELDEGGASRLSLPKFGWPGRV